MTIITIATPLKIKKTHFANARDAADFLLAYAKKEQLKKEKNERVDSASQKLQRTKQEEQAYGVAKKSNQTISLEKKHIEDYTQFQQLVMSDG